MKQRKQLFTQTEIANKLGISKGTLSKWISKNNVSPEKITGNKKLYTETIISDYRNAKRVDKTEKKASFSTIEFLKKEVETQKDEIARLNKKIDEKDSQIKRYADQFANLAVQAQQLNLVDKDSDKLKLLKGENNDKSVVSDEKSETKQETNSKHWWQRIFNR